MLSILFDAFFYLCYYVFNISRGGVIIHGIINGRRNGKISKNESPGNTPVAAGKEVTRSKNRQGMAYR